MVNLNRRSLLAGGLAVGAASSVPSAVPAHAADASADETFWRGIASHFDPPRDVIHLENGNWGMMPRPVRDAYVANLDRVNRDTSFYGRRGMGRDLAAVREHLASALAVPAEEIAFTRNATEALKALIGGYNRLAPGDAILYADLDYDSMQRAMDSLALRKGVDCVRIRLPEPASKASLIEAYAEAFERHPNLKLVLLTHLGHRTGLVIPVQEIARLARERGIDVILDAAHSWRQLDFNLPDLDCDFVGMNGHKWLAAPLGVGILHIRKSALSRIDRDQTSGVEGPETIGQRLGTGTLNSAAFLTVGTALDFDNGIGMTRKAARLRALRGRWVHQVMDLPAVQILTPEDPELYGAITAFRLRGQTSGTQNTALARRLLEDHRIFTVDRGLSSGGCVRVTPALFNSMQDMDALANALKEIVG
jgi:isopenicillin-N epimerase